LLVVGEGVLRTPPPTTNNRFETLPSSGRKLK
jgi:hypothetical protein